MTEPLLSQVTEIANPDLRMLAKRVLAMAILSAEKATAHYAHPDTYHISTDTTSLEHVFLARLEALPQATRDFAAMKVMQGVTGPAAVRERAYGDLAKVDLRTTTSVMEQVDGLPFPSALKMSPQRVELLRLLGAGPASSLPRGGGGGVLIDVILSILDKLEFRIHEVRCIDETNAGIWGEVGEDEIRLGGTTIDATGVTTKVPDFKVGDFEDNDVKRYTPAMSFASFDLNVGTAWPKSYFVTLVLAEEDWGGVANFLNRLADALREKVAEELIKIGITAAGLASGGPIGAAIGAAVAWVLGKVFEWLKSWWADEVFPPSTQSIQMASLGDSWAGSTVSPQAFALFKGHGGEYQLTYDWSLSESP